MSVIELEQQVKTELGKFVLKQLTHYRLFPTQVQVRVMVQIWIDSILEIQLVLESYYHTRNDRTLKMSSKEDTKIQVILANYRHT